MVNKAQSNFTYLAKVSRELAKLGQRAEQYFSDDPNTSLIKLRQFGELLAQEVAARFGVYQSDAAPTQIDLIRQLDQAGALEPEVRQLFHILRISGNAASHSLGGDYKTALEGLKVARELGLWFYRTLHDPDFNGGPFIPPKDPVDETASLKQELLELQEALQAHQAQLSREQAEAGTARQQAEQAQVEARLWEELATEAEQNKEQLKATLEALQEKASTTPANESEKLRTQAKRAGARVELDEPATRLLIDKQLCAAGWEADTERLRHANGTLIWQDFSGHKIKPPFCKLVRTRMAFCNPNSNVYADGYKTLQCTQKPPV